MTDREAALQDTMREFGEAWARGDVATLEAKLSPNYIPIDANGRVFDRAGWLRYAGGRSGRATRITFHDVRTRISGDVAVVTGTNEIRGGGVRNAADTAERSVIRFTQTWMWREGRWLRESFQATSVGPEASDYS